MTLSQNTRAVLLLTAPLLSGGRGACDPLTPSEYRNLTRLLRRLQHEPADLLGAAADDLITDAAAVVRPDRLRELLDRGHALSKAHDRWVQRSIWVASYYDPAYPVPIQKRLREEAPPVFYGVGDPALINLGGLAVVGSRNAHHELVRFAKKAGRLAAQARLPLVSGGARGVDQAAMRGASEEGGMVVGVLADSLQRAAVRRDYRRALLDRHMVLLSAFDPSAGFHVGHAMQRNKLIYALSDAALVVNADLNRGGTWSGAVEQLEKLRHVPVYVRADGSPSAALDALRKKGALPWPSPQSGDELSRLLSSPPPPAPRQLRLLG